mmetsp:Transcript_55387/g.166023  ORF Transcript_55387/g.166023 Transcript_55387/m.166023 type:complete len:217 (-) Transcript_55387:759-1409(-)
MMYPPRNAPTTTLSMPNPPHPPPALPFVQYPSSRPHTAPREQSASDAHMSVPNPSHPGLRRKKGNGTSNQKSRLAKRNRRARLNTFRLRLSSTKISFQPAFFFLAVPKLPSNPKIAHGMASATRPIMTLRAVKYDTLSRAEPRKYPTPLSEFFQPVMSDTRRNNRVSCSSGVTNLVTVFPPNFVRSLAMPANICATVTNTIDVDLSHPSSHANSNP